MRILLADDQVDVRSGLKCLLEQEAGFDIIGEAEGLGTLLMNMKQNTPDLVLLDWELANIRVADIIPVLKALCPGLRIIAMSGRPEAEKSAMISGADAFVSKGEHPERLLEAIRKFDDEAQA